MKTKIFIDGSEGTTGLRIHERFQGRDDIELLKIDPELRKDPNERKRLINESDITFLCLPDAAAREAVAMIRNNDVIYIPAATVGLFMVQNLHAISFWNTLIDSSKMTVGLYPKEKIGFDSIVSICPANRLDALITDWDASEEDLKLFDEQEIEVVVVDKPE